MRKHESQQAVSDFLDLVLDFGMITSFKREAGIVTTWSSEHGWIDHNLDGERLDIDGNLLRLKNTPCNTPSKTNSLEEEL